MNAWALVLSAKGVSALVQETDGVLELHVAEQDVALANAELDASDREERETARAQAVPTQPPLTKHASTGAVVVALALLAFFAVTGPRAGGSEWFAAGAADAERVVHGEWWRAVTALTLHADSGHVL
ncbi:MAG TPA: rhomboid family intramembrane serine protease, partial [Polyangiales bacterium]